MEFLFKDLSTKSVFAWFGIAVAALALGELAFHSHTMPGEKAASAVAAWVGIFIFLSGAIYRASHRGPDHLLTVVVWSAFLVISGVVAAYFTFFAWPGSDKPGYDKILNVIPVFAAIWAAALGWFVHYQLTSKSHRTKNSFDILMQMRMSSEFRKQSDLSSKHFPPGSSIPSEYTQYFPSSSVRRLYDLKQAGTEVKACDLERAEAVIALKYLLNYFEFMAVGIKKGDLDEQMLYETISTTVIGTFTRAKHYVDFANRGKTEGGSGELLAFCFLCDLVKQWDLKYDDEVAAKKRGPAAGSVRARVGR